VRGGKGKEKGGEGMEMEGGKVDFWSLGASTPLL